MLIVPAAGAGSRLGGDRPKILVPVAGRPMIDRLVDLYWPFADTVVVVAHPSFSARLRGPFEVVEQHERSGMLDAVLLGASTRRARSGRDEVWVTWGDQVGVLPATVARLAATMASAERPARRDADGDAARSLHSFRSRRGRPHLLAVRQRREGDAMPAEGRATWVCLP